VVQFLRVANIHFSSRVSSQSPFSCSNDSSLHLTRRSFATRPGRPKGHTGRAAASKKTTASKASATKKAAKPKTKSKPEKKAKATKPKLKKRTPRPLSEAGKLKLEKRKQLAKIRDLKATALSPPKKLPDNAWTVYVTEQTKGSGTRASIDKSMAENYRNFTVDQKEASLSGN